jgi:hypothetical protein
MKAFPTNRGSKYIVKLSAPLNFGGQTLNEDVDWEAALTSVHYTNRFYEVREPTVLHVAVQFPNVAAIEVRITGPGLKQMVADLTADHLKDLPKPDGRFLKQFIKAAGSTDASFVVYGKIAIPAGHYKDPSVVHDRIVAEFNRLYGGLRYNTTMQAIVKGSDGTIHLKAEPQTNKLYIVADKPSIVNLLGMTATELDNETPALYKVVTAGTKTPRFDTVQSLFIYSDIIKPQHVGDTLAPLLEIVPVQGVPGQRVQYCFNQLTYLPVNRTYIESIEIEICDEYGNHVVFPDDVENVICRLRFRRSKHSALVL